MIEILSYAAGIAHDFGKAGQYFQDKLSSPRPVADPVRHEIISAMVYKELIAGKNWVEAWKAPLIELKKSALSRELVSYLDALEYLVISHHRMPTEKGIGSNVLSDERHIDKKRKHEKRLPVDMPDAAILHEFIRSTENLKNSACSDPHYLRVVATLSRAALVLADQSISAIDARDQRPETTKVYANTISLPTGKRQLNQSLDWHLHNVAERARVISASMQRLPFAGLSEDTVKSILTPVDANLERFKWQDRAVDVLRASHDGASNSHNRATPTIVLNSAGTGSGKTRGNIKILLALAGSKPRVSVALNLRTLTLQTSDEFRKELNIDKSELATVTGSAVVERLHSAQNATDEDDPADVTDTEHFVHGGPAGASASWLQPLVDNARGRKQGPLLEAPVAVCTVDYLVAAGEPGKQANHALALLRVMHGDLILDEIDQYDPAGLAAVCRLILIAAMCGRHVIASSATLSREVATAVHDAYKHGIILRTAQIKNEGLDDTLSYQCAFVDDKLDPVLLDASAQDFAQEFAERYDARIKALTAAVSTGLRIPEVQRLCSADKAGWLSGAQSAVEKMHHRHSIEVDGINVSIGLLRIANIAPAITTARFLADSLTDDLSVSVRVCCYHSQHTVIQRYFIEAELAKLLSRKHDSDVWAAKLRALDVFKEAKAANRTNLLLVVVATPVAEVGRDFDFDYGVIDVSSAQSIVQTAGRVNRHRLFRMSEPNIALMQYPYKFCDRGDSSRVLAKPGFEPSEPTMREPWINTGYDIETLLDWCVLDHVDAGVRFDYRHELAALDGTSLTRSLKEPIQRICDGSQWMSGDTYTRWSLREREVNEMWHVDRHGNYFKKEYLGYMPGRTPFELLPKNESVDTVSRHNSDWLVLSLEEQFDLCHEIDIDVVDGMSVSLPPQRDAIKHDPSFGFMK